MKPAGMARSSSSVCPRASRTDIPLETEWVAHTGRASHSVTHTLCVSSQGGVAPWRAPSAKRRRGDCSRISPRGPIVAQTWPSRGPVVASGPPRRSTSTSMCATNIGFMGMGEPLDNLDAVLDSIRLLTDRRGCGIAPIAPAGSAADERPVGPRWRRAASLGIAVSATGGRCRCGSGASRHDSHIPCW